MQIYKRKQNALKKINIIAAMIALFIFANSNILFSQTFKEVNFPDGSIAGVESIVKTNVNYKIYQSSQNVINFDLPEVAVVSIGLYDLNNNLVRTYIYNNLLAGSYEIKINPENLSKGNYTCVLSTDKVKESSRVIIE